MVKFDKSSAAASSAKSLPAIPSPDLAKAASGAKGAAAGGTGDTFERLSGAEAGLTKGLLPSTQPLGAASAQLADAYRARGLQGARELGGLTPEVAAVDPLTGGAAELAGRDGSPLGQATQRARERAGERGGGFENPLGKLAPDLPNNQDRGPAKPSWLVPSTDPRAWLAGAAAGDGSSAGVDYKTVVEHEDANGNVQRQVTTYQMTDGSTVEDDTYYAQYEQSRDGSANSNAYVQEWRTVTTPGADGSVGTRTYYREGPAGQQGEWRESTHSQSYQLPRRGLDRLLDAEAPSGGGYSPIGGPVHAAGPAVVTWVNPGPEGATPQPQGARLRSDELASDPWEARPQAPATLPDPDALRSTLEPPVQVNPPAPGEDD